MNNLINDFVYLDGQFLREEQIVKLALNADTYVHAEHYLFALLTYGVINGKRKVINEVNKVREHFNVKQIPVNDDGSADNIPTKGMRVTEADVAAQQLYLQMDRAKRIDVLKRSLQYLMSEYHLFLYSRHWLAIYLVIKDRLVGDSLNQVGFLALAEEITPEDFPIRLKINVSTTKNFSREIRENDRGEVYYRMKCNRQKELCDTFWGILQETILTEN